MGELLREGRKPGGAYGSGGLGDEGRSAKIDFAPARRSDGDVVGMVVSWDWGVIGSRTRGHSEVWGGKRQALWRARKKKSARKSRKG